MTSSLTMTSRRRSRSPYDSRPPPRTRSPLPSRRSPPAGPRGDWRARSRSPRRRDDRVTSGPTSLTWRRRSPSPPAATDRSSGKASGASSQRSSPPVHPSRLTLPPTTREDRSYVRSPMTREDRPAARSPLPRERSPFSYRESSKSTPRERSPVRTNPQREPPRSPRSRSPPRGPAVFRPPPTGPSATRHFSAPSRSPPAHPPSGPASMSAHNRPDNASNLAPPAGPRGYVPPSRGSSHPRGGRGGSFADRRQDTGSSWGGAPPTPVAPTASPTFPPVSPASNGIPTGPRASSSHGSSSEWFNKSWSAAAPRATAPASASFARPPQPRVHPALANLPQIIPAGKKDPSYLGIPKDIEARLKKNEEESERLREELKIKEEKLRAGLRTWDKLERESKSMSLKAELSEKHVRLLAGEGVGGTAF